MRIKADLTLLLISMIWGSGFVAQRIAGQLGSVYFFNGVRYLLAALVVLPFAMHIGRTGKYPQRSDPTRERERYKWMFVAGILLFVGSAMQQAGMQYTTAGNAGFITGLYVVLVPLVLFVVWREMPNWLSLAAVILAGAGAFSLSTGGRFEVYTGNALELAGAIFWTFHVIVLGKFAARFEPLSFSIGQLVVCGVLNLIVGVFIENSMPVSLSFLGAILYTAFFSIGLCYTLQIWAQRHTPPADAALILSLESIFAVISGWIFLNEILTATQVFGCILIFIAVLLSQIKEWNSGKIDRDHLVEGR